MGYPTIDNPEGITNVEQMTFAITLGDKLKHTAKGKTIPKVGIIPKLNNPSILGEKFGFKPLK